jgi:hypothetical protein
MEHLKLFAARLNIPRLIRVCEEQQHWRELVFLYVAYDEYDNAALVMMAHRCRHLPAPALLSGNVNYQASLCPPSSPHANGVSSKCAM